MRLFLITIFCLLSSYCCQAQYQSFTIRNYKAIDGLPQSQVNVMLEDKNGYLWIGTEGGGLARFDGRTFKVYTTLDGLLSNIVSFLKLDSQQNLWIVHPRGITKFNGVSFKTFQQPVPPSNARRIRRVYELNDTIFIMAAPGFIGKIYKDSVYTWSKTDRRKPLITYNHLTPQRNILLYRNDSSFQYLSKDKNVNISHKPHFNRLFGLIFNYNNRVWMRSEKGYYTLDPEVGKFEQAALLVQNPIVCYDSINDVFWTRYGTSLLKEAIRDGKVRTDTVIRDVNVRQVFVDSEGNTWFASAGSGLFKYFTQDFDRCSSDNMRTIMAIHVDSEGTSWVGSMARGLWKIKKGKMTHFFDAKEPYRNAVYCINETSDGAIWVGTAQGLAKYDGEDERVRWFGREDGLSNASISELQIDEHDNVWIGTFSGGVNRYDGTSFKSYTVKDGLNTNTVNSLFYSRYYKQLFIGNEFGLSTLQNENAMPLVVGGIENTTVLSIHSYLDSLLLIGTGGAGIAIYNPATRAKTLLTTRQGLASDFIYFVAADDDQYIWVGTEKGISRIRLTSNLEIVENLHYDYDNGLTGVETNQNAFYLGKEEKFFGLIDGLYQFNNVERDFDRSFDLHLTDVQILFDQHQAREFGEGVSGFYKIPTDLKLPPDRNHITFHFNRVDKRYPKSVKFKYYLQNFDKTWSQPSSNHEVTYSNLPPGDYIFRVTATDAHGSWTAKEIAYPFTIKTPFYQTASFLVGVFLLLAGAVTLVLYMRVKRRMNQVMMLERIRAKEQETLRKEIARDFHDEMGNQLTRIINYVSLLKLESENKNGSVHGKNGTSHNDLYAKVEDSAKYLYTGTRDFIWSIDPGNDELSKLFIHIRDFGEKLFEEKNINFRAFNEVKEKAKLPYGFSREANLIFKEAMTNAFKYSEASNVSLSLQKVEDGFEMIFEDDGKGFYTGDVQKSNGLKNIRERADRINAVLRIHSVKNEGTKIVLAFKLNKTLKYGLAL